MTEYLIEVVDAEQEVTHVLIVNIKNRKEWSLTSATKAGYEFCTKFKNKETAQKYANKINGARVVPSFGGYVNSTKSAVAEKGNKVNSKTAFSLTMTAYRKNQY